MCIDVLRLVFTMCWTCVASEFLFARHWNTKCAPHPNASNDPPRGGLRDSPNDDHRVSVVSFDDQGSFGVLFCVVPSKTVKGFCRR